MAPPVFLSPTSPLNGLSVLAPRYDLILCDVWGVVHDGRRGHPEAVEALMRFRKKGGQVVLVTNAPHPYQGIIPLLESFGVSRDAYDAIASSGDATLNVMERRRAQRPFHLGPSRDDLIFQTFSERFGVPDPRVALENADYCICTGLWRDDDLPESYAPLLRKMAERKLTMICANPDIVVHVGEDLVFCAGALARDYAALGGEVVQAGKPFDAIYETAYAKAPKAATDKSRILAIGDGLGTDMRGAALQGIDGLFISQGIHRDALYESGWSEQVYQNLCAEHGAAPLVYAPHLKW